MVIPGGRAVANVSRCDKAGRVAPGTPTRLARLHTDAIEPGKSYAVIDDLIATGGTAAATADLIELQKGRVACCAFVIELDFDEGRTQLYGHDVHSLIRY